MRRRDLLATVSLAAFGQDLNQRQIERWMEMASVPGVWLTIFRHGKSVRDLALGARDTQAGKALDPSCYFEIASLTKQFTAYVAHELRAAGTLDFDKPLNDYLGAEKADPAAVGRTARHVLSHGAGFPNWRQSASEPLKPEFEPLTRFRYSGEGYVYLVRAIEAITQTPFGELIHSKVFTPLGMSDSAVCWTPDLQPRMAPGHDTNGRIRDISFRKPTWSYIERNVKTPPRSWTFDQTVDIAKGLGIPAVPNMLTPNYAASLCMTGLDYAKFAQHMLQSGRAAQLTGMENNIRQTSTTKLGWGLGWGVQKTERHTRLWQWGDNRGYKNFVLLDPANKAGIFVFTNGDGGRQVYDRLISALYGDQPALLWLS
ncbi:hypothetical protein F183_A46220 [Bryobacterales bacterium F-183]|nr:hypothetical protein F183_A46220 [Bryobacterales bacterium F-183]